MRYIGGIPVVRSSSQGWRVIPLGRCRRRASAGTLSGSWRARRHTLAHHGLAHRRLPPWQCRACRWGSLTSTSRPACRSGTLLKLTGDIEADFACAFRRLPARPPGLPPRTGLADPTLSASMNTTRGPRLPARSADRIVSQLGRSMAMPSVRRLDARAGGRLEATGLSRLRTAAPVSSAAVQLSHVKGRVLPPSATAAPARAGRRAV